MRVLVTGADGFIGRGVVEALLRQGNEVVAADLSFTDEGAVRSQLLTRVACDSLMMDDPYVEYGRPDAVLHLAWRNGFSHNDSSHIEELPKHCAFIERCIDSGIKRICVMGSMHEIGYHEGGVYEKTPCFPQSRYGIAKNALRDFCFMKAEASLADILWLRGFYIVDASTSGCSIFSKIAQASLRGETSFPFTTGKNEYDFLDYRIFCDLVADAVVLKELSGIVNICSGKPEPLASRVERFIGECGFDIALDYGVFPDRPYDSPAIWGGMGEAERLLHERLSERLNDGDA